MADIKDSTKRKLAAISRGVCSYPKCGRPIVIWDEVSNEWINVGQFAHINGDKPRAARYDPDQSPEERRSIGNIVLYCYVHHKSVDTIESARFYPASLLRDWKNTHEENVRSFLSNPQAEDFDANEANVVFSHTNIYDRFPIEQRAYEEKAGRLIDEPEYFQFLITLILGFSKDKLQKYVDEWASMRQGPHQDPLVEIRRNDALREIRDTAYLNPALVEAVKKVSKKIPLTIFNYSFPDCIAFGTNVSSNHFDALQPILHVIRKSCAHEKLINLIVSADYKQEAFIRGLQSFSLESNPEISSDAKFEVIFEKLTDFHRNKIQDLTFLTLYGIVISATLSLIMYLALDLDIETSVSS